MTRIRLVGTVATFALTAAILGPAALAQRSVERATALVQAEPSTAIPSSSAFSVAGGGRHRIARPRAASWFQFASDETEQDERSLEDYVQDDQEPGAGEGQRGRDRGPRDRRDRDWRNEGPRGGGYGRHARIMRVFGRLCGPRGERMVERMLTRLERITRPTDAQRASFDKLRDAAMQAGETARAGCPVEQPMTLTGRLGAIEKRLEALLQAVRTVRPALEEYFSTLDEEQKARVYAAGPRPFRHGYGREGWREQRGGERYRERRREERGGGRDRRRGRDDDDEDGGNGRDNWRGEL